MAAATLLQANDETIELALNPPAESTICFWFRFNGDTGGTQRPFSAGDSWELRTVDSVAPYSFALDVLIGGGATGASTIPVNEWFHIAVVASDSGNFSRLYINGELYISNEGNATSAPETNPITLGSRPRPDGIDNVDASYQDVRVYDRLLTVDEILTIVDTDGHDDIVDGLIARHTFEEEADGSLSPYKDQTNVNTTSSTIDIATPQHVNGDILIAIFSNDTGTGIRPVINPPVGWTLINVIDRPGGANTGSCNIFYKVANNEPITQTFTRPNAGQTISTMISYDGEMINSVPQENPVSSTSGSGSAISAPSVILPERSLVIRVAGVDDNDNVLTVNDAGNVRLNVALDQGNGNGATLSVVEQVISSGPTGTFSWTNGTSGEEWRTYTVVFNGASLPVLDISGNNNEGSVVNGATYDDGTLSLRKRRQ